MASTPLSALEPFELDALYGRLAAEGKGPRTVKHHQGVVSSALGQARKWRWGTARTWPRWRACRRPPKPDIRPRLIEQLGALLAAIAGRSPDLSSLTQSRSSPVVGGASCAGCAGKTVAGTLTA